MTVRELRQARKLTQVRMARVLGITPDSVSRLEKRSDLLLSTLRKTVEAIPDRAPGCSIKASRRWSERDVDSLRTLKQVTNHWSSTRIVGLRSGYFWGQFTSVPATGSMGLIDHAATNCS